MNRDQSEFEDAHNRLGIAPISVVSINQENDINLMMGVNHQETLTLAKAVYDCSRELSYKVNIIVYDPQSWGYFILDNDKLELVQAPHHYDYALIHDQCYSSIRGDQIGFFKYTVNKNLTGIILRQQEINSPKELVFRKKLNEKGLNKDLMKKVGELFKNNENVVLKPATGDCGNGVEIIQRGDITDEFYEKKIRGQETLLLQEFIEPYPINLEGQKMDWNLRVLVTYDVQKKGYTVLGMIGRIDKEGGPVNISISADYITFDQISELIGWKGKRKKRILKKIHKIAKKSVKAVSDRISNNYSDLEKDLDHQDLAGVDIIVDKRGTPHVIELNPTTSCGPYQLMVQEGIEKIYPFAKSVLVKMDVWNEIKE